MPKVKRFVNPLRSAPQSSTNNHQSRQDQVHTSLTNVSPPNHDSGMPSNSDNQVQTSPSHFSPNHDSRMPSNSEGTDDHSPSNQGSQDDAMHIGGRRSSGFWKVGTIDGILHQEEQVIVYFEGEQAIGDAEGLLAGYLGLLAIDCKSFPISFRKWTGPNGLPPSYFEECFINCIRPKFYFKTFEDIAKRYCKLSLSKKWSQHRLKLWDEFYDSSMSREALIANVPTAIDAVQWAFYVQYRLDPSTMEMCRKNKEARKKQTIPHTGATEPKASRRKIYIETHKKKDGSIVTDEARAIAMNQYRLLLMLLVKFLGKCIRGGCGAWAYFLSKEGCIPSEFAGILGRDAQVPYVDSEPDTPTTAIRSSGEDLAYAKLA
ncbi:hypothetical protein PIB30_068971 [Stylosanthes scabra]|uniref:Uncharacterized protein n=1 Tax=Stylosanthes scabra TaxID=79078 RepID=A0ABU6XPE3_9FABA|nr:hypothetical protein [Stylosanthes scabra]